MTQLLLSGACRALLSGLLLAASAGEALAVLGQAPTIPAASSPSSSASSRTSLYTLHEVHQNNGTVVREYATPAGQVFAVTWRGPVLPDLSALLGTYFNTFKRETDQARQAGKHGASINMNRDGLVIRSNGRMRNFFGYAYAPGLIPAGVDINNVLQ